MITDKIYQAVFQSPQLAAIKRLHTFTLGNQNLYYHLERKFLNTRAIAHFPNSVLLPEFIKFCRKKRYLPLIFSHHQLPYKSIKHATVIIPIEQAHTTIKKNQRRAVKRAQREGVIVREVTEKTEWDAFLGILTGLRQRKKGMSSTINTTEFYNKYNTSRSFVRLAGAYKDNVLIAGALFYTSGRVIFYSSGGAQKEFQHLQPIALIFWHMVQWGKENGYSLLDMAGYKLNAKPGSELDNINRFKERWGTIHHYRCYFPSNILYALKKLKDVVMQ